MEEEIRVRFAPSPTGKFHIGSARVALFNYLFAKKNGGKFIVRIEDTDVRRSNKEDEADILDCLAWLGLEYDEGPDKAGQYGPYRQSERGDTYKKYIEMLLQNDQAYYCWCTSSELEAERQAQGERKEPPKYSGWCRHLTEAQKEKFKAEGRKPVIRYKVEEEKVEFEDLIRGKIEFDTKQFGDFVIADGAGRPLFLLTNVVDDALMKITHVLRGEDHISNTPKQFLLMKALNFLPPEYGHLPMILNPDRTKMSKRKDPTSVSADFRDKGILPEALVNFMAFLGWSPGTEEEIFSLESLVSAFSLDKVGKSPSIFNTEKLLYLNGYYIRRMKGGELAVACLPFLERESPATAKQIKDNQDYYLQVIALVQERLKRLDEVTELTKYFFEDELKYDAELLIPKGGHKDTTIKVLEKSLKELAGLKIYTRDELEKILRGVATEMGVKDGEVLWPVRVAMTGEKASPGVFELLEVLGKERVVRRMEGAARRMTNSKFKMTNQ